MYKKQVFGGVLKTGNGDLNFDFTLDNLEKYVNGKVSSKNLELGKVMNINGLGALAASAQFTVDISKPRTAEMRRQKGGKLPIGYFNATVDDCLFKGIHFRNISATLNKLTAPSLRAMSTKVAGSETSSSTTPSPTPTRCTR